jgi:hypothetical protein
MSFQYPELERFWDDVKKDPHREFRASFIFAARDIGIKNSLSVDAVEKAISKVFNEKGFSVTIPALRHLAYQAPDGTQLKQWAVSEVVRQSLKYADQDKFKAMAELRKAACFKYEDKELEYAVVGPCMTLARARIAESADKPSSMPEVVAQVAEDLRDAAYWARPGSLLDKEASRVFKNIMEDQLKSLAPDAYVRLFVRSLNFPFPGSYLEHSLIEIAKEGLGPLTENNASLKSMIGGIYVISRQNKSLNLSLVEALGKALMSKDEGGFPEKKQGKIIQFPVRKR